MPKVTTPCSPLQSERVLYQPRLPEAIKSGVVCVDGEATRSAADEKQIQSLFPGTYGMPIVTFAATAEAVKHPQINVGVILSGGQAPGGHNVICGLFDRLKLLNPKNHLYGFLGGPSGLIEHDYIELTAEKIAPYRNTGGFDIIGSGRTKLETPTQFESGLEICRELEINAIVIIGGDDSNTNACVLAEYFKRNKADVQVIGCPKTIDGDLKNEMIETSFGFDTACKVYSELIGNIQRDAASAQKYWHFVRLMGRSASHITLECALQTHPNIAIISEEIEDKQYTLDDVVNEIVDVVKVRGNFGYNYGTVLVPEGLIEFIPNVKQLIAELNDILAVRADEYAAIPHDDDKIEFMAKLLSEESAKVFRSLPINIALQLTLDRDPHGNVQVSLIETERLLISMVGRKLKDMKASGEYKGKFATMSHFFGYEGRCSFPSNFDTNYCYVLGCTAALLIDGGKSGYMASVRNLTAPVENWVAGGVPITMMLNLERRKGEVKPVIKKALVDLKAAPFKYLASHRADWVRPNEYLFPGPIQFYGSPETSDQPTKTLLLEQGCKI